LAAILNAKFTFAAITPCTCAELLYRILTLIVVFDIITSPWRIWDCSHSVTGNRTLVFGYKRYGRPTLTAAGPLVVRGLHPYKPPSAPQKSRETVNKKLKCKV